jgi:hypothetical protein
MVCTISQSARQLHLHATRNGPPVRQAGLARVSKRRSRRIQARASQTYCDVSNRSDFKTPGIVLGLGDSRIKTSWVSGMRRGGHALLGNDVEGFMESAPQPWRSGECTNELISLDHPKTIHNVLTQKDGNLETSAMSSTTS